MQVRLVLVLGLELLEEGLFPAGEIESFYTSDGYCHCNFTALNSLDEKVKKTFVDMMLCKIQMNQ